MGRGRGRRGRRGCMGGMGMTSSAAEARLMAAAASGTCIPKRPWWSLEAAEEKNYCLFLYRYHMEFARTLGAPAFAAKSQQKVEDLCGHYKSLWSSWWTDKDDRNQCKEKIKELQTCEYAWECKMNKDFVESMCKSGRVEQSPPLWGRLFTSWW